jgi:hypothetical protein
MQAVAAQEAVRIWASGQSCVQLPERALNSSPLQRLRACALLQSDHPQGTAR